MLGISAKFERGATNDNRQVGTDETYSIRQKVSMRIEIGQDRSI